MRPEDIMDSMDFLDDELVKETQEIRLKKEKKRSSKPFYKIVIAACLCVIAGTAAFFGRTVIGHEVIVWNNDMKPEEYFKYSKKAVKASQSADSQADYAVPYDETRIFSDFRNEFEREGMIPLMPEHPLFWGKTAYMEDGRIYSIELSWHKREKDGYSDLIIRAGYEKIPEMTDCIVVETDVFGRILTPAVTVTKRDGIEIIATRNLSGNKTLTFENGIGWFQIEGSWNDSYEDMIRLLDWIWEHPLDFSRFEKEKGIYFEYVSLEEYPDAFAGYLPIPDKDCTLDYTTLTLKNGAYYALEAHWFNNEGKENLHWCIDTEPDYYDRMDCKYKKEELTKEIVMDTLKKESNIAFFMDGLYIKIYSSQPELVWNAIDRLSSK